MFLKVTEHEINCQAFQSAIKFFLSRVGLRFAVVFVFIALQNIHCLKGLRTGERRASVGGDEVAGKHPIPLREARSVKNNATPNLPDILGRMQAMEKKYVCD